VVSFYLMIYSSLHAGNLFAIISTQRFSLPIMLAVIAVAVSSVLLFRLLRYGILDVLRHYSILRISPTVLRPVFDGLISLLLGFIILFPPLAFGGVDPWAASVLELSILILFFLHLFQGIRSGRIRYRKNSLNVLFFVFILGIIAQLLLGTSCVPYRTFMTFKTVILYFALFFVIVNRVKCRKDIDHIIATISLAGLLVSSVAIMQLVTGTDKIYWTRKPPAPVFFGPFTYWNHFSCYVALAALLTLGSLCYQLLKSKDITWQEPKQTLKDLMNIITEPKAAFLLLSFSLMTMALFLAKSRAAILCFVAMLVFFLSSLWTKKSTRKAIPVFFSGIVLAFLIIVFFLLGTNTGADKIIMELRTIFSAEEYAFRVALYTIDAPKIFKAHPFFGIGLASLYDVLPLYLSMINVHGWGHVPGIYEVAVIPRYIFNDTLQLLLEMGSIVFLILAVLFVRFIFTTVKIIRGAVSRYKFTVGMGIISAIFFFGLHSSIDYDVWLSSLSSLLVIILSLALLTAHLRIAHYGTEIAFEERTVAIIKTKRGKIVFFVFSAIVFGYFALIVCRPLIVNVLTKREATLSSFRTALAIDPKNDRLRYTYHKFLLDQYQKGLLEKETAFRHAEAAIDRAIRLNPYKTSYLVTKGDFELRRKRYNEAALIYQKAATMEPHNPIIQMGCAAAIFWQAIHERNISKRSILTKKGNIYYSKARALSSGKITLASIVKNKKVYTRLIESLRKEGVAVQ